MYNQAYRIFGTIIFSDGQGNIGGTGGYTSIDCDYLPQVVELFDTRGGTREIIPVVNVNGTFLAYPSAFTYVDYERVEVELPY